MVKQTLDMDGEYILLLPWLSTCTGIIMIMVILRHVTCLTLHESLACILKSLSVHDVAY